MQPESEIALPPRLCKETQYAVTTSHKHKTEVKAGCFDFDLHSEHIYQLVEISCISILQYSLHTEGGIIHGKRVNYILTA